MEEPTHQQQRGAELLFCFYVGPPPTTLSQRETNSSRGARSARTDARLCTSSGINLIVPLSFHLVR